MVFFGFCFHVSWLYYVLYVKLFSQISINGINKTSEGSSVKLVKYNEMIKYPDFFLFVNSFYSLLSSMKLFKCSMSVSVCVGVCVCERWIGSSLIKRHNSMITIPYSYSFCGKVVINTCAFPKSFHMVQKNVKYITSTCYFWHTFWSAAEYSKWPFVSPAILINCPIKYFVVAIDMK